MITLQSTHTKQQSHIKVSRNVTILANLKGSEEQLCGDVNLLMDDYNNNVQIDLGGKTAYAHKQNYSGKGHYANVIHVRSSSLTRCSCFSKCCCNTAQRFSLSLIKCPC